jgi:phenylalanine-4-hydroxylase
MLLQKWLSKRVTKQFHHKQSLIYPFFKNFGHQQKSYPTERYFEVEDKTGLIFSLKDRPGVLADALSIFSKNKVNLTYINSKPSKFSGNNKSVDFFVDLEGKLSDKNIQSAMEELKALSNNVSVFKTEEVPWFPKSIQDLNMMGRSVLSVGDMFTPDHPGLLDEEYKRRRQEIVHTSNSYNLEDGDKLPVVNYTEKETNLWSFMWDNLLPLQQKYACREFNDSLKAFIKEAGFSREKIPQLSAIYKFLKNSTNTIYRPVGGLLTQREFLNGLAFRVFHSTQYIRHHSAPLYTPEPDIIHEVLGHAPLFANKDFADFSQEIGLASLAASDEDIEKLGTIYWFTIEFGVCLQENERKIYGAGILSSPSEIEWAMSDKPQTLPFDIHKMANQPYNVYEFQKYYFLAPSFAEMKKAVVKYSESIKKPFNLTYNTEKQIVEIDRHIVTRKESSQAADGQKLF